MPPNRMSDQFGCACGSNGKRFLVAIAALSRREITPPVGSQECPDRTGNRLVFENLAVVVAAIFVDAVSHDELGAAVTRDLVDLRQLALPLGAAGAGVAARHLSLGDCHWSSPSR